MSLARGVADTENVGVITQFREMVYLYATRQLGPLLYFEARLWRRDLTMREKQRFLNEAQYKREIDRLNPPAYRKFSQHKLAEKSLLRLLGIPTPAFIGFFHSDKGIGRKGLPLTNAAELAQVLAVCQSEKICFKPVEGWGGEGFIAAQINRGDSELTLRNLLDETAISIEDFVARYIGDKLQHGYVIEAYFEQHAEMSKLNPSSVNSLRVWVIRKGNEVNVLGGALRMGRRSAVVDNAGQGGISAPINLDDGTARQAIMTVVAPEGHSIHPDSGEQIEGRKLPFWPETIRLAQETMRVFPEASFAGLDIAISPTGPVILEMNLEPNRISARSFGAPTLDLLT